MKVQFNAHDRRNIEPPRPLGENEQAILEFLLSAPFPGQRELCQQLEIAKVTSQCHTCPTITFTVNQSVAPRAPVARRIPIEAKHPGAAPGHITLHVLLHVVNGYLDELELYRSDLGQIASLPSPSSLELLFFGEGDS
jgi:hypothetical protein